MNLLAGAVELTCESITSECKVAFEQYLVNYIIMEFKVISITGYLVGLPRDNSGCHQGP